MSSVHRSICSHATVVHSAQIHRQYPGDCLADQDASFGKTRNVLCFPKQNAPHAGGRSVQSIGDDALREL